MNPMPRIPIPRAPLLRTARRTVLFSLLLAGCVAQAPVRSVKPAAIPAPAAEGEIYVPDADVLVRTPGATDRDETADDPTFHLFVAEFAGQRGRLDVAVAHYLSLARQLRTESVAERATKIAVFGHDNDAALEAAKIWVAAAPNNLEARQILAAMYIRHGDADAALENLEIVVGKGKGVAGNSNLRMVAMLLSREDDKATALTVMEKLVARHEGDADALLAYALLAIRADRFDKARAAMDKLVAKTDVNTNVAMSYVALLQKQGLQTEAVAWLEKALARTPDEFGLRMLYARMLADAHQYERARLQFELLAKKAPDNIDVIFALGLLNLQANRVDQAEQNFKALLKYEDRAADAHYYLGQIAESRKQIDVSLAHYRAVRDGTNRFMAQIRIAFVLSAQDKVDEARAQLKAIAPENDEQKLQLVRAEAEILADHERYQDAIALYDAALNGTYNMEMLYTRAMLAEKLGKMDVLEADLRTIIKREPENAQALNALGYSLVEHTDRYEEAYGFIKQALAITPDDFYVLDSMGWVLYRLGKVDEAVPYLKKAHEQKNDPEVAAHLGEVLWVLGKKGEAREIWDAALKQKPDDKGLRKLIERLAQ